MRVHSTVREENVQMSVMQCSADVRGETHTLFLRMKIKICHPIKVAGLTSILVEGSPVYPTPYRFAEIIQRECIHIFKAGSTFLRSIMAACAGKDVDDKLASMDLSSLRMATFCAEPVNR